jgi:hypothetical protein
MTAMALPMVGGVKQHGADSFVLPTLFKVDNERREGVDRPLTTIEFSRSALVARISKD